MAQIIQQAERLTITTYSHEFSDRAHPGSGFSFTCTKEGALLTATPSALANYQGCLTGTYDVIDHGVVAHSHVYTEPALLRCDCGKTVYLDGFTNTCACGADYNMSGSRLAPRSQWGGDTNETVGEILMGACWDD